MSATHFDLPRLVRTVMHLRPRQIAYNIVRRYFRSAPNLASAPELRIPLSAYEVQFPDRETVLLADGRFVLLNRTLSVESHRFAARKGDLLWDYHFHYFDGLLGQQPSVEEKWRWISTWADQVSPGSRPAWDPYPISRRVMNWIKWAIASNEAPAWFMNSLAAQVRYLCVHLEYHLLANHLLSNAVALSLAGAFFGGDEGESWWALGVGLLETELPEQFLGDGAHYELSPVYHCVALEDLLDLMQVVRATGVSDGLQLDRVAAAASDWLRWIRRPDGRVPLFNDAAHGVAQESATLLDYAARLGVSLDSPPPRGLSVRADSGYFRYEEGGLFVVGDLGGASPRYQPGHLHCDMLSFELFWKGCPVIVDVGTSTYEAGSRRAYERGTSAHNTVQIGDREQTEIWAAFRVGRRGRAEERFWDEHCVRATIRAFPPQWAKVHREWRFEGTRIEIRDRVESSGRRREPLKARLHFHPDAEPRCEGRHWVAGGLRFDFKGATRVRPVTYELARGFNQLSPAVSLEIDFEESMSTHIGP